MKTSIAAFGALLATTATSYAAGLDRSGQGINLLFQDGNYAEIGFRHANPTVEGTDPAILGGGNTGNIGESFNTLSGGVKYDFNDQWSGAIIFDEPFGVNSFYGTDPATSALGGTGADVDSFAVTAIGRYKFNNNWSVHAGLRYQEIEADVTLDGIAFAINGLNGFGFDFDSDGAFGYLVGVAYEVPEIALRVALTYNSEVDHDLPTTETLPGSGVQVNSTTEVTTPESVNLTFQSGVAPGTLVFGSVRYARYSQTVVNPQTFTGLTGNSLTDLESGYDFELGVARQFNDKWAGSVSIGLSTAGEDDLVSPLLPVNGSSFISVGARYNVNENVVVSGGVRYTRLRGAVASPAGNPVSEFDTGHALGVGMSVGFKF